MNRWLVPPHGVDCAGVADRRVAAPATAGKAAAPATGRGAGSLSVELNASNAISITEFTASATPSRQP
ncbi:hypothetical protein KCP76_20170 [Salmonella enterica subsp. enterica serovar Weltevreden]|nr:hypothetical protein KCP76_20170 [Salmonella enterica subsp. enterica serovar Weltevreden]